MPIISNEGKKVNLRLVRDSSLKINLGQSEKIFFCDEAGRYYLVKKPRLRNLEDIFKKSLPRSLKAFGKWTYKDFDNQKGTISQAEQVQLYPYFRHIKDLAVEAALGEVLYMKIAREIFPASMETPDCYLHLVEETGEPWVISLFLTDFREFIEEKLRAILDESVKECGEWENREKLVRENLQFSENELYLLGKLYCTALLTHDWDLVNNIMLSNSGCIGEPAVAKKVAVVDGGNKLHFGFGGLTCAESARKNRFFNPKAKEDNSVKGYNFTFPFDSGVFLTLPRQIIPDLFSFTRQAFTQGFSDMVKEARDSFTKKTYCSGSAFGEVLAQITEDSHLETRNRLMDKESNLLNHGYYLDQTSHSLDKILRSRLASLETLLERLAKNDSVELINGEVAASYYHAQCI